MPVLAPLYQKVPMESFHTALQVHFPSSNGPWINFERKEIKIPLPEINILLSHYYIQMNLCHITTRYHVKMGHNLRIIQDSYEQNYFKKCTKGCNRN